VLWNIQPNRYVNVNQLESKLGYVFVNKELLFEALTHRSALACLQHDAERLSSQRPWNERLEFLGDSVLGLVISECLISSGLILSEGDMSRIRAAIVCAANLARIGRDTLSLGDFIVLGTGELASGGRTKANILADALEAIFGAVFKDSGWSEARRVILTLCGHDLDGDLRRYLQGDYKTKLQEWTQAQLKGTPVYQVISEMGPPHERQFEVEVKVHEQVLGFGAGASKKDAAQAAAKLALSRLTEVSI
jgi:ribonuclease III